MKNILNKRNMIKIASLSLLTLVTLSFTACRFSQKDGTNKIIIDITIPCETTPTAEDISNYITVNSGDEIVKDDDNTTISIYHDINGTKKVCLVSGSAHIEKQFGF